MFQNFYCYEINFGFLSFLNPVTKTVIGFLKYEKLVKFVSRNFFFTFDEILVGNHG